MKLLRFRKYKWLEWGDKVAESGTEFKVLQLFINIKVVRNQLWIEALPLMFQNCSGINLNKTPYYNLPSSDEVGSLNTALPYFHVTLITTFSHFHFPFKIISNALILQNTWLINKPINQIKPRLKNQTTFHLHILPLSLLYLLPMFHNHPSHLCLHFFISHSLTIFKTEVFPAPITLVNVLLFLLTRLILLY